MGNMGGLGTHLIRVLNREWQSREALGARVVWA